ncbi:type 1 fimbrial protein [Cronobacter sakazakii]|nr:type 1 fimbrial protein [Cronobacter sakazakii]
MKSSALLTVSLIALALFNYVEAADNVHFSGALVAESCTLPESDQDIHLDFGTVTEKALYQYHRTKSQPFTIHLENCNPAIAGTVNITFEGTADSELTDSLSLDAGSTAQGVAIGLERMDGTPLPINKPTPYFQLTSGNNPLTFNAYIQAQSSVITNESLKVGDFTATSSFVLDYQ